MKKRRGERLRPCPRCETSVKYLMGTWLAESGHRQGWHWVNKDGTHHRCGDFIAVGANPTRAADLDGQWREAMERDGDRTGEGVEPAQALHTPRGRKLKRSSVKHARPFDDNLPW